MIENNPPTTSSLQGRESLGSPDGRLFWTWDMVEEALVEALLLWRRMPDRERGWHAVRAFWPEMRRHNHFGDYADTEGEPRPLPLSRGEVARMEAVGEWMAVVPERDKRLVALALAQLAAAERDGRARQVKWSRLRARLGGGIGARGLGMRYSRALGAIARALNEGRIAGPGEDATALSSPSNGETCG